MAYCDYCNKGIGPHSEYEFLFHQLGMFGGHPKCMRSLKIRLDKIQIYNKHEELAYELLNQEPRQAPKLRKREGIFKGGE